MYRRVVPDVGISARQQCAWNLRATESTFLATAEYCSGFLSLTDKRSSVTTRSCENDSSARRMPHIVSDDSVDVPLATTKSSGIIPNNLILTHFVCPRKIEPTFLFHIFGRFIFARLPQIHNHFVQKTIEQRIITPFRSFNYCWRMP